jgi:hypothetical protein
MEKFVELPSSTNISKYAHDELLFDDMQAYQKLLLNWISGLEFKEMKICISRPSGKSFFYDKYMVENEKMKIDSLCTQYIDPEILAEINTNELIKEMEKNDVLNKRRNQKSSPRINRRSYQTIGRSKYGSRTRDN